MSEPSFPPPMSPSGVSGWLGYYTLTACVLPLVVLRNVGFLFDGTLQQVWPTAPLFVASIVIGTLLSGAMGLATAVGVYKIFTRAPGTRSYHIWVWKTFWNASLFRALLFVMGVFDLLNAAGTRADDETMSDVVAMFALLLLGLLGALAWWKYWEKSVRVMNTFPAPEAQVLAQLAPP